MSVSGERKPDFTAVYRFVSEVNTSERRGKRHAKEYKVKRRITDDECLSLRETVYVKVQR